MEQTQYKLKNKLDELNTMLASYEEEIGEMCSEELPDHERIIECYQEVTKINYAIDVLTDVLK